MGQILAIDIGNTNVTTGTFKNGRLVRKAKVPTYAYSAYGRALRMSGSEAAVISSVVPRALCRVLAFLKKASDRPVYVIGRDIDVPIKNLYRKAGEVGKDRLVNAFAAKELYGAPAVVVDFGTAVTFDIVSKKGEYLGGLIMPGINLSLRSLYDYTALMPKVKIAPARNIIGNDTVSGVRGGILFGFGAMCDGLASEYRRVLGESTKVIATGGDAPLVAKYAKSIQVTDVDLTLKGLSLVLSSR